jgi:hypothetical protein
MLETTMTDINADLLYKYKIAEANLAKAKEVEMIIRLLICDALISHSPLGTNKFLIDGYAITAVKKINYNLDKELLESKVKYFTEEELECIRWKPELAMKNYKALDDTSALDEVIITTPATPSLEIKFKGE